MAKKMLEKKIGVLYHYDGCKRVEGPNPQMEMQGSVPVMLWGNCTGLYGDCFDLKGDCSGLSGDFTGIVGDCTNLVGEIKKDDITQAKRQKKIHIGTLVK